MREMLIKLIETEDKMTHQCKLLLAIFAILPLVGCAVAPLDKVQGTLICEKGQCSKVDPATTKKSVAQVKKLLSDGLSSDLELCESKPTNPACTANDLGMFVVGGVVPGRGAIKSISVLSAVSSPNSDFLKLRMSFGETFYGVPLICAQADAILSVTEQGKMMLEVSPHFCNWVVIGNLFSTFSLVIDRVDLSARRISGFYSAAVVGTGNGQTSGYVSLKVPDTRLDANVVHELNGFSKIDRSTEDLAPSASFYLPATNHEKAIKIALVIGNAAYKEVPLDNTTNDAEAMADALGKIGFKVIKLTDADYVALSKGVNDFIAESELSSIALIYYAGHGVEVNGRNLLVGTDVDLNSPQSVVTHSIDVTKMLSKLGDATQKAKILILDACRDNPFPSKYKRQQQGLAQVEAPVETFIAFSTSPGRVALDGTGKNSPYTKRLVSQLTLSNLNIESVFRNVRKEVVSDTNGKQTPWENTSLTNEVLLDAN